MRNPENARSGGQILIDQLIVHRVDHLFCVPGESYLAALDALHDAPINVTVCRQEGGAAMMAEAYGKLTGRPGLCFVTRGPGATNASPGILDAARPLGERGEHCGKVDLLKAFPVAFAARDIADEQDHRSRILVRDVDADRGIGGAGAARDEGDARPPRHLPVSFRHVGDAAFLPADDEVDLGRVVKRVEDGEETFAGHREYPVAPLRQEIVDEDASAGARFSHEPASTCGGPVGRGRG